MADEDNKEISNKLTKSLQPKWKNSPMVSDLDADYTEAQAEHSLTIAKIGTWLDNLNVEGAAKHKAPKGRSSHVPQVIRKQAEWRYSSLSDPFLSTADVYDVQAITHEDKPRAEQSASVLNNQWNTVINKQKFVDDYVHTIVDEGTVIVRVGWSFAEVKKEKEITLFDYIPDLSPENMQMMLQAQQLKASMPDSFNQLPEHITAAYAQFEATGIPHIARPNGSTLITTMVVTENKPTVEVVKYTNIVIDPTCNGDLDAAMFAVYSFETSHSQLKKAGKYKNLDKINNARSYQSDDDEYETSFNFTDKPRKKFEAKEYWGYWDIDGSGIVKPIVATYVGDVMVELRESPYPDGKLPFVAAQYLPKRRKVHGEPDGELLADNQKIIGATTRGMIDLLGRSANSQIGHRAGSLDPVNRIKFRRGEDYEYTGAVQTPADAFYMHKYPEIPQSAQFMVQLQNQDAESLTGVKAFTSGITGNALGDSVGGQRNALDATAKREVSILRRLADGVVRIGAKIDAMNGVWLSEDEITRITNKPYIAPRDDEYGAKFDLRVTVSTADEDNAKASELSFMLQTMGNTVDFSVTKLLLIDIAKLRKMPKLAQSLEEYEPTPDPLAIEKAKLENQVLQLTAAKLQAEIAQITGNATLLGTKAVHEEAKTEETKSKTDVLDLQFVEQESGVTQERELQKQKEATSFKVQNSKSK